MPTTNWEQEVRNWIGKRRNLQPQLAENFIEFFRLAFDNTAYPQQSWFGKHNQTLSLVIGGIFLAAVVSSGVDKGIWLLVDDNTISIKEWGYLPTKSTRSSIYPLYWLHTPSINNIAHVVQNKNIWPHYANASDKILLSPRISRERDSIQISRGKQRLSDFWTTKISTKITKGDTFTAEEIQNDEILIEGSVYRVTVNAYERNTEARNRCIAYYGAQCAICEFDFGATYGEVGKGYIHVHHLRQLADIREDYQVNPVTDLRPVCANCHAIIHRRTPPYSIEEIKNILSQTKEQKDNK